MIFTVYDLYKYDVCALWCYKIDYIFSKYQFWINHWLDVKGYNLVLTRENIFYVVQNIYCGTNLKNIDKPFLIGEKNYFNGKYKKIKNNPYFVYIDEKIWMYKSKEIIISFFEKINYDDYKKREKEKKENKTILLLKKEKNDEDDFFNEVEKLDQFKNFYLKESDSSTSSEECLDTEKIYPPTEETFSEKIDRFEKLKSQKNIFNNQMIKKAKTKKEKTKRIKIKTKFIEKDNKNKSNQNDFEDDLFNEVEKMNTRFNEKKI